MGENRAKLVVLDLADIGRLATQMGNARNRVGRRSTADFLGGADPAVKINRALHVDQLHDAFADARLGQKCIIGAGQHIDHGVADSDNLKLFHRFLSSNGHRSRIRQAAHLGLRATQM